MQKKFSVTIDGNVYNNVYLLKGTYPNGEIGLILMDDHGFLCILTVSVDFLPCNTVALNTNEVPEIEKIVQDLGIGKLTGFVGYDGYCECPLCKLDMDRINELCGKGETANE